MSKITPLSSKNVSPYDICKQNNIKKQKEFKQFQINEKQNELLAKREKNKKQELENLKYQEKRLNNIKKTNEFLKKFHDDLSTNKYPEWSKEIYDYLINNEIDSKYLVLESFNYDIRILNSYLIEPLNPKRFNGETLTSVNVEPEINLKNKYLEYFDSVLDTLGYRIGKHVLKINNPNSILNGFEICFDSRSYKEIQFNCNLYINITKPETKQKICNIL